jgi:nucleoside-diphosphate-sugar epimerase
MKRVLVTGASGFIGRHSLKLLLDRGFEVHAVVHRSRALPCAGVRFHRTNLLDPREVKELFERVAPSHLLNFAWFAVPGQYHASEENFRWCQAGIDLLLSFAASGGSRAVFAGSCFEYDLRYGFCSEHLTPCEPSMRYGACKLSLSHAVTRFPPEGVSAAWARVFYLYGPHEAPQRLVASVILSLLRGEKARCGHGRQVRDFLHVSDVADAFVTLLESQTRGVVNIGSGIPITVRSLVERIAELMEVKDGAEFGVLPVNPADPPLVIADTRKLHEELGWAPRWSLDEGLLDTIEWWRANAPGR